MRNQRLNAITYGAVICALTGVILLVNRYLANSFDLYLFWILPLPVIIYSVKFGTKQTIIMALADVLLSFIVSGNLITLFYATFSIIAGIVYGDGMNRGKSAGYLVMSVISISLFMTFVDTFLLASFFGIDLASSITELTAVMQETLSKYYSDPAVVASMFTETRVLQIYVITCIITCVMEGFLIHMFAYLVMKKMRMTLPPMTNILKKYAPAPVKLFVFTVKLAYYLAIFTSVTQYNDIIIPLALVAQIICMFYGYLLFLVGMRILAPTKQATKFVGLIAVFILFIFGQIYNVLGMIDIFTSIRRRLLGDYVQNELQN